MHIVIVLIGLLGGLVGWQIGATKYHAKFFEYWANDCRQDGGVIQDTETRRVECFKDGVIINHVN